MPQTQFKGAILDTNASVKDATDYMLANNRIAAFGKVKDCLKPLVISDTVFLYRTKVGIISAAKVTSLMKADGDNTCYCDVDFLITPDQAAPISASNVKQLLGHGFFWAKTLKAPFLTPSETKILLTALRG